MTVAFSCEALEAQELRKERKKKAVRVKMVSGLNPHGLIFVDLRVNTPMPSKAFCGNLKIQGYVNNLPHGQVGGSSSSSSPPPDTPMAMPAMRAATPTPTPIHIHVFVESPKNPSSSIVGPSVHSGSL